MGLKKVILRRLPEAVIVLGAVYCAGIAVYGATTIGIADALSVKALVALGAPAVLALLLALALRLPRSARMNLALVLGSFIAAILLAEAYLTVTKAPGEFERMVKAARDAGRPVDPRTRLEVVHNLRSQGIDAVPFASRGTLLAAGTEGHALPVLGGVSMATTVICNESGQHLTYTADERGFNNPHGLHGRAPLQVALLGDSFTQGLCVPDDASIAGRIRASFPHMLSLGVTGAGPLREGLNKCLLHFSDAQGESAPSALLTFSVSYSHRKWWHIPVPREPLINQRFLSALARFIEYAAPLRPRFVVWNWFEGNDLSDLGRELAMASLRRYQTTDTPLGLADRQDDIDRILRAAIDAEIERLESREEGVVKGILLLRAIRDRLPAQARPELQAKEGDGDGSTIDERLAVTERILATVRNAAQGWGGELVAVYLPAYLRYCSAVPAWREHCDAALAQRGDRLNHRDDVLEMFDRLGLPVIDGHAIFEDVGLSPTDIFYYEGSHYTPAAYGAMAEAVLRKLRFCLTASGCT